MVREMGRHSLLFNTTIAIALGITLFIIGNYQSVYATEDMAGGTYEGTPWRITSNNELIIGEDGTEHTLIKSDSGDYPWDHYNKTVESATFVGTVIAPDDCGELFRWYPAIKTIDITNLDMTSVDDMDWMFGDCEALETVIGLSNLDTSNVEQMYSMFNGCTSLKTLDLSNFDTLNVTNMEAMFADCTSLKSLDIHSFNTSNVTTMNGMFSGCESLTTLNVSSFDTLKVEEFQWMFQGCSSLKVLDISTFNTSNAVSIHQMFDDCTSLEVLKTGIMDYSSLPEDVNHYYYSYTPPTFPVDLYDSSDGTKYSKGVPIPEGINRTYVSNYSLNWSDDDIKILNNHVTVDMLFGEYNKYLNNRVYNEILNDIQTDVSEIISSTPGYRSYASALIYCLENVTNAWYDLLTGSLEEDTEKDLALELINDLSEDEDVVYDFVKEANKKLSLSKKGLALPNAIRKKGFGDIDERTELAELMVGTLFSDNDQALEYVTSAEKKWNTSLIIAGTTMTYAEAVLDVWAAMEADAEILDILYKNIGQGTMIEKGLIKLMKIRAMQSGRALIEPMAEQLTKDGLSEITGKNPILAFMKLSGNIGYLLEEAVDGAHVKTINKAIFADANSYEVNNAVTDIRTAIANNYNDGNIDSITLQKEYGVLYAAEIQAVLNSAEHALKIARGEQKKKLQEKIDKYDSFLCYKKYINSCIRNANSRIKYVKTRDGVIIVGAENSTKQLTSANRVFSTFTDMVYAAEEDDEPLHILDIPETIEGKKVISINDGAFSDNDELSCVFIPRSVKTIGEGAFSNCNNLTSVFIEPGLNTIGSNAFSGCINLDEIELPESIKEISTDAFSDIDTIDIIATEGSKGAIYAEENDNANLIEAEEEVSWIEIQELPSKLTYGMSEPVDPTGIKVEAFFEGGSSKDVSDSAFYAFEDKQLGNCSIIVSYKGAIECYDVNVLADECNYTISYLNEFGEAIHDTVSGSATAGTTIDLPIFQIEGYTAVNDSQCETIGEKNNFIVEYKTKPQVNIADVMIADIPKQEFTGSPIKPLISMVDNNYEMKENIDYYVDYGNNLNVGKGLILITGINKYKGSRLLTFDIIGHTHKWKHIKYKSGFLKNGSEFDKCSVCGITRNNKVIAGYSKYYVKSFKVSKAKKSFTVTWKKQSKAIQKKFSGYQIRYSLKSNMKGAKYATAKKSSTSKKISKLKAKKIYYVQVRTYMKKSGKIFYSKWSTKKSVKTK